MSRFTVPRRSSLAWIVALALVSGCCCPPPQVASIPVAPVSAAAPATVNPLDVAAARAVRVARLEEPAVTERLQALAAASGGDLVGLDHRLKTFASTKRKIASHVEKAGTTPEAYEVYDALRYTLCVADEPAGHHGNVVYATLAALEADGYEIGKVKNYWPRGDSYSGTNCWLRTPAGIAWEIQFHTPISWATKSRTHDDYELMRADDTPIERKRALFRKMTAAWEDVAIPEGILEERSLHALETIKVLPSP